MYVCKVVISEGSSEANAAFVAEVCSKWQALYPKSSRITWHLEGPADNGETYVVRWTRRQELAKVLVELDHWDCLTQRAAAARVVSEVAAAQQ